MSCWTIHMVLPCLHLGLYLDHDQCCFQYYSEEPKTYPGDPCGFQQLQSTWRIPSPQNLHLCCCNKQLLPVTSFTFSAVQQQLPGSWVILHNLPCGCTWDREIIWLQSLSLAGVLKPIKAVSQGGRPCSLRNSLELRAVSMLFYWNLYYNKGQASF